MIGNTAFSQFNVGTIPKGDSVVIRHDVTIIANPPLGTNRIAAQWTIQGSNFSNFVSDDPDTPTPLDSTITALALCDNSTLPTIMVLHGTICAGAMDTLVITSGSLNDGTHWQWYTGSCGGTPATIQNALGDTLFVSPSVTTTYYVRGEGNCVSGAPCASATITVNQKSADPTSASASPSIICDGESSTLTLTGGGGGTDETIKWYTASCGGTLAGMGNSLSVSPTTTTTYYGRYENGAPCNYNSLCAQVTLTVNQKSADPTSASASPSTICNGQSSSLMLNGGGGGTGETIKWYTASCGGTLAGSGNDLSVSPTTTTTYYGRYEDAAPCNFNSLCAQVTVTVNQISTDPTSATADPTLICIGASSSLMLNGGGGGTGEVIKWYTASCGGTMVGSGNSLSVSPTMTTTYYGRYEDPAPCNYNSLCAQVTVMVQPNNTITLTSALNSDDQAVLVNTAMNDITYATTGATDATFTGLPLGVNGSWGGDVATIMGTPMETGIFDFTVTLTGGCGTIMATGENYRF